MILVLTYPSSAEFWLQYSIDSPWKYHIDNRLRCDLPEEFRTAFVSSVKTTQEVAEYFNLSLPLSLCCPTKRFHRHDSTCICDDRYTPFPEKGFVLFNINGNQVYIASPELTFLEAARKLNRAQLVCLGNSLCKLYEVEDYWRFNLPQYTNITTPELIKDFLATAKKNKGLGLAKSAILYVLANSNSPMESKLAAIINLPQRLGGYGLPAFSLNERIILSSNGADFIGCDELRGDFHWKKQKYVLEYDSNEYHSAEVEKDIDSKRQHAFELTGYRSLPIRYDNVRTYSALEKFMKVQRINLGCVSTRDYLEKYKKQRNENYQSIFKSKMLIV